MDTPPTDVTLGTVLNYISNQFGLLGAQIIDISNRQDILRDRLGALNETHREATQVLRDRVEELERLRPTIETTNKVLTEIRPMIEDRLQHAGRVAEGVRSDFAVVSARYQQSISEIQIDFEEKYDALQKEVMKKVTEMWGELDTRASRLELDTSNTRISKVESDLLARQREDSAIATARIGRSERVAIAAISVITSIITALFTYLATRPPVP